MLLPRRPCHDVARNGGPAAFPTWVRRSARRLVAAGAGSIPGQDLSGRRLNQSPHVITNAPNQNARHPSRGRAGDLLTRWSFMMPSIFVLLVTLAYPIFYTIDISFSSFDLSTFGAGEF